MFCRYCGGEIGERDQFCQYCGREQDSPGISKQSRKLTELKIPNETKNPGAASSMGFLLGWILLGPVGYIYLEQWNWFWLTFIIQLFAIPLTFGLAYIVLPVVFAFHQYQMAKEINKRIIAERDGKKQDAETANVLDEEPEDQ